MMRFREAMLNIGIQQARWRGETMTHTKKLLCMLSYDRGHKVLLYMQKGLHTINHLRVRFE